MSRAPHFDQRPRSQLDRERYLHTRYGGLQSFVDRIEQRLVYAMLDRLETRPRRVLDAPSGHGRFTPALRELATDSLVCMDGSQRRLATLKESESGPGTPFETRIVNLEERLPFEDGEFDLVFCFRYFHHVADAELRRRVVTELLRVSNQYALLSYYDSVSLHYFQKILLRQKRIAFQRRREVADLANAAGWKVREDRAPLPLVHGQRIVALEKR